NGYHYYEWRKRCRSFADLAIMNSGSMNLTAQDGPPERLGMALVSANLLPMLGGHPLLGRHFTEEEDRPGSDRVVILTDALWRRRFRSDPAIVNKKITLNGNPFLVAGVMPPWFHFPRPDAIMGLGQSSMTVEFFRPLAMDRAAQKPVGSFNYTVLGR